MRDLSIGDPIEVERICFNAEPHGRLDPIKSEWRRATVLHVDGRKIDVQFADNTRLAIEVRGSVKWR